MRITEILPNLSPDVARYTLDTLLAALPPPVPDTPENRAKHAELTFAAFASLRPANPVEAMLAAQVLASSAQVAYLLRLAAQPGLDPRTARQARTQAGSMARCERDALRMLQDSQKARSAVPATWPPAPPEPTQAERRAAEAAKQRAARIRALDLRLIDPPPSIH